MTDKYKETEEKIKALLADHLGTDPDDIDNEDSFIDDLNMRTVDLSDFFKLLSDNNFVVEDLEITDIKTVGDLIDIICSEENI